MDGGADVMPLEVLTGPRADRWAWFMSRGLLGWPEQYAAIRAARAAHGVPEPPDPRPLLAP